MSTQADSEARKTAVRQIIRDLHGGMSAEKARERILSEVGSITSTEITTIEQSLIAEGIPADEIKRFCNVHALIFEAALEKSAADPGSPSHPVTIMTGENVEIQKILAELKTAAGPGDPAEPVRALLARLEGITRHYAIKEQALFPYLEKHGFTGPSQVMWAKHDEVRGLLKKAVSLVTAHGTGENGEEAAAAVSALAAEVDGMIFKEQNILFPAALERLSAGEWVEILKSAQEIGFPFAPDPGALRGVSELAGIQKEAFGAGADAAIELPSGRMKVTELAAILDTLPVDITFVDAEDKVRYFSQSRDRIFVRARSVLGRSVQNCHPPQSVHKVTAILDAFRAGTRSHADFWITLQGKMVSIRYFALRDAFGQYLGCLEVSQDLTPLRALQGERRLLDDA
jgi:uncharacterized protein